MNNEELKIAVIGGGTGSFTLLKMLKLYTPNITAIVNMSDDGGSTGVLRDELGVLPPGDIRQCLVALSNLPDVRDLFDYRFGEGSLKGHSLGNVILSGLELKYKGNFLKAIDVASRMLNITGIVEPVTLEHHRLVLKQEDRIIEGQYLIETSNFGSISTRIMHEPKVHINPNASKAIEEADQVVIAPGNLFSSLLPAMAVEGVAECLSNTRAKVVMVSNLVTKPGQTDGWHVVDYVKEIEKYIGKDEIDYVLYNQEAPSDELLSKYARENEFPVNNVAARFNEIKAKPIPGKFVSSQVVKESKNDIFIPRTLIRHDAAAVCEQLIKLYSA